MIRIIKQGDQFTGKCDKCRCEVLVDKFEVLSDYVSRIYPKDSIGWAGDNNRKIVYFIECPNCKERLYVTKVENAS